MDHKGRPISIIFGGQFGSEYAAGVSKESYLVIVFPKSPQGDAEESHAFAEAYPCGDGDYTTVNLTGVIGGDVPFGKADTSRKRYS